MWQSVTWLGCGLCDRSNITWAMHICNVFWLNKKSFHLQSGKRWVGVGFGLIGHDEDVKVQPERFLWCLQDLSPILKLPKLVKTKSSTNKLEQKKTNPPPPSSNPWSERRKQQIVKRDDWKTTTYTLTLLNGGCHHGQDIVILEFFFEGKLFFD
jgi:hypothetical protein